MRALRVWTSWIVEKASAKAVYRQYTFREHEGGEQGDDLGVEEGFNGLAKEVVGTCVKSETEPPCHQVDCTPVFR